MPLCLSPPRNLSCTVLCCRTSRQASSTGCCWSCLGTEQRDWTCVLWEEEDLSSHLFPSLFPSPSLSFLCSFPPQEAVTWSFSAPSHPPCLVLGAPQGALCAADSYAQVWRNQARASYSFIALQSLREMKNWGKIKAGASEILERTAFLQGSSGKPLCDESRHVWHLQRCYNWLWSAYNPDTWLDESFSSYSVFPCSAALWCWCLLLSGGAQPLGSPALQVTAEHGHVCRFWKGLRASLGLCLSVHTLLSRQWTLPTVNYWATSLTQCSHSQGLPSNQNEHLPIRRAKPSYYGYQYMKCTNPWATTTLP